MTVEWAGPVFALVTVLTIWVGHVMVRKVNYHFGTRPVPIVAGLGVAVFAGSFVTNHFILSGVLGIVGVTTCWDAFELVRQESRVRRGHAPMNPKRSVH